MALLQFEVLIDLMVNTYLIFISKCFLNTLKMPLNFLRRHQSCLSVCLLVYIFYITYIRATVVFSHKYT